VLETKLLSSLLLNMRAASVLICSPSLHINTVLCEGKEGEDRSEEDGAVKRQRDIALSGS
jgi:hypothetical protein